MSCASQRLHAMNRGRMREAEGWHEFQILERLLKFNGVITGMFDNKFSPREMVDMGFRASKEWEYRNDVIGPFLENS